MDYKKLIGNNIKLFLKKRKKSQKWLAEKVDTYPSHIHKILSGQSMANEELMDRIADALGCTVPQIFAGDYEDEGSVSVKAKIYPSRSKESDIQIISDQIDEIIANDDIDVQQQLKNQIKQRLEFMFSMYQ